MASTNIKGPWDIKFLREQPFMAFGSMMNSFGNVNQGKGMDVEAFKIAAKTIWNQAVEFAQESFDKVTNEESMHLPIKKAKNGDK